MSATITAATAAPHKFTDVMIDLEGCSDLPDAAPHQIGVAFFDLADPARPPLSYQDDLNVISSLQLGMSITPGTLVWWDEKLDKPISLDTGVPIRIALEDLARSIKAEATRDVRVWSRGNSYDLAILKLLYRRAGWENPPWQHWMERDVRSHLEALGQDKRGGNPHVALEDCLAQIRDLHAAGSVAALRLEIRQRQAAYDDIQDWARANGAPLLVTPPAPATVA